MDIKYFSEKVYGVTKLYFDEPDDRQTWYNLTGRKTITQADMGNLSAMFNCTFTRVFGAES